MTPLGKVRSKRTSIKTGDTLVWEQSLDGVAENFPTALHPNGSLIGLTAQAQFKDGERVARHTTPIQSGFADKTALTFTVPDTITRDFVIGSTVVMDVLYTSTVSSQRTHTETIRFLVIEGITQPPSVATGSGSFGESFGDSFRKGSAT